jgi:beta-phosphoglucomutase-like phosphatase (HAD superfamily)
MILAVIFDLDGTLVETEELKALSYARAAVELRQRVILWTILQRCYRLLRM